MKTTMRPLSLVCLCVIFAALAWSQSSYTASVRGTVTDSSGAALVAAKVTILEADRNVAHTATTDEAGRYVMTALPPGGYTLTVEAAGFKKYNPVSYTHLRAHETRHDLVCRLLLEKKK